MGALQGERMARRKESAMDVAAAMPWPAGVALGVLAHFAIRFVLPAFLAAAKSPILKELGQQETLFAQFAWLALAMCWIAAAASYFKSQRRKRLLNTQTGLDSIAAMTWREFEMLVGEAFRRQGYSVEETGLGGADGGIDLILRKDGRTELVQCKQWRNRQIKSAVVREMWGLVDHHRADGVKIVCVGQFTRDAEAFAGGKAIELVNGERLLSMIRGTQEALQGSVQTDAPSTSASGCPKCGGATVRRVNRRSGEQFWGCASYPRCKESALGPDSN